MFGGTVHEGMADLMYMMNTLLDKDGKILVEGLMDDVKPVTSGTSIKSNSKQDCKFLSVFENERIFKK